MQEERFVARYFVFNGVGLLGLVVQLAVLAGLVRIGVHPLTATAIAVECAVLHNFIWHQRWTWADRPAGSSRSTLSRLWRFHLLNGSVSLAGNLGLMVILAGPGMLDPLVANLVAVILCSLINFVGSQLGVFRAPARVVVAVLAMAAWQMPLLDASGGDGVPLRASTLAAWQSYERRVDERYGKDTGQPFFAQDAFGAPSTWRRDAAAGGTPMLQLHSPGPGSPDPDVPDGRIHHWAGAVFVPGLTLGRLFAHLDASAGHEAGAYDDVVASRLIGREGNRLRVYLKLRRTRIITATYNTEHLVEYRRIGPARGSGRSVATRIAELADAGTPEEREKPAGADSGYLWKLDAYWRYEETAEGVLIECESVSLSRNVPALLRPFISGVVEGVARESLERTLLSLRRALLRT